MSRVVASEPERGYHPARAQTAAELFVRCLENEGVEYVFGIPGEETLDINQALEDSTHIDFTRVRHESGAAFMADAWGRLTGPAWCLSVDAGPRSDQPGDWHR